MSPADRIVRVGCPAHNCGGRCLLRAHIQDGVIVRLETDDRPDEVSDPQLRACTRGRAYLRRQYHADRLMHPLRRVGRRGEGRFERIDWDEALDLLAGEISRVREVYGNGALFVPYGTGSYNQTNGSQTARRLLNLYGGCLGIWNSYSWGATNVATPTVYGTAQTGNQRQDWLNARLILMWGWNPAEMRDGTNSEYFVKLARERGARVVCIDPRLSMSAAALADEWVPIRPGTDVAMMSAMAYVMLTEGLHDADFVRTHCQGVDRTQMPPGCEDADSWSDYLLGTRDGQPKTPAWAEPITGVPRESIVRLAREYATTKPGVLYQGYGMQRRAYGEQVVRAGAALAALTGNVGVPGGWASGLALQAPDGGPFWNVFPVGENPVGAAIPCFLWTEAVLRGTELGSEHGVLFDGPDGVEGSESAAAAVAGGGVDVGRRLDSDIKLIWAVATNALVNQHANINRTARILADEARVEFIAVQDHFLTPTARFADLVLPACTQFETWGLEDGWKYGDEVLLMPPLVDPPGECRSDYRICANVAERLGIGQAYTEGRDERGWVEWALDRYRETRFPDLPSLDEFEASNRGVHSRPVTQPAVALADFRADPEAHPLLTPSGRIEVFSKALHDLANPEVPAVPKYIQEWESPGAPSAPPGRGGSPGNGPFPLQAVGHHSMARVHSTHDNNDWLADGFPQRVFINDLDAAARGIQDGDLVRVWNDRGEMALACRVTPRIMPGVIDIPQGAWWSPDEEGVDRRGSINVLTSERWTPLAFATAQHTCTAEVERVPGRVSDRTTPEQPARGAAPARVGIGTPADEPSSSAPAHVGAGTLADELSGAVAAPSRRWAFHLDSAACSGCKACQVACQDRHGLGPGVRWRRVYEVVGGGWERRDGAWLNDVVAYNLSISCNHCEQPICVEVCPAAAMTQREDGLVLLEPDRCIGCRYCEWACPYGAPQYDEAAGRMTKCTFCVDDVDGGGVPACVSACPLRALDFGLREELEERYGRTGAVQPLPDPALTGPSLVMRPHRQAVPAGTLGRDGEAAARVGNREEVASP